MKILIIVYSIGKSPAGKVFETYINELADYCSNIDIICAENFAIFNHDIHIHRIDDSVIVPNRLAKLVTIILGKAIKNLSWEIKARKAGGNIINKLKPGIILTFASGGSEAAINAGYKLSRRFKIKHAIHMCDPIPVPRGWETYEIYRKSLIKPIKNALRECTFLSMNTEEMIRLQQASVKFDLLNKSFVSPDPVNSTMKYFGKPDERNRLLFLGTFYSARKPDKLVLGFSKFIQEGNDAELHIIGHSGFDLKKFNLPEDINNRIIFSSWKEDISEEYRRSRVLVDVDADIENDVFISSKLKSYLAIDRVILSVTRNSSPSYKLLSEVKTSSVISEFNEEAICSAIKRSLSINYSSDLFNDRKNLLQVLSAKEVVGKMAKKIGAS